MARMQQTEGMSEAEPAAVSPRAGTPGSNYPVIRDKAATAAVEEYHKLQREVAIAEARMKVIKTEIILPLMGGAPEAAFGVRRVTQQDVAGVAGVVPRKITRDMVGQIIPGKKSRAGYVRISVE